MSVAKKVNNKNSINYHWASGTRDSPILCLPSSFSGWSGCDIVGIENYEKKRALHSALGEIRTISAIQIRLATFGVVDSTDDVDGNKTNIEAQRN